MNMSQQSASSTNKDDVCKIYKLLDVYGGADPALPIYVEDPQPMWVNAGATICVL